MTGRLLDYAGPVLRDARERAGATQREVAERAGAGTATVSRLENGIALPSDPLIDAIVDAYCVVTGVPRLELLERATADWQQDDYGEVKGPLVHLRVVPAGLSGFQALRFPCKQRFAGRRLASIPSQISSATTDVLVQQALARRLTATGLGG
jgi:transcriptional regulator with XRE-family HTH domain